MRRRIAMAQGDLTGDGVAESVWLTGVQQAGSAAWQQIALEIEDGASGRRVRLPLPQDVGYDPQITLGNMSSRDRNDVLVSIDSGGSGGIGYYTIYAYMDGMYRIIFDSESYNAALSYSITFLEHYVVRAESLANGMVYLIDISGRDEDDLRGIYRADGTLRAEQSGFVDPLSLLYPADINRDGMLELVAWQRISGLYHADGLGDFINTLSWTGRQFALTGQTVGIFGASRQL